MTIHKTNKLIKVSFETSLTTTDRGENSCSR